MGHLETVFPPARRFQSYPRGGDRVPDLSVTDMKGGLMVMRHTLKALDAKGLLEDMAIND